MSLLKGTKRRKSRVRSERIRTNELKDPTWEGASEWSGEKMHHSISGATEYYYKNYKSTVLIGYAYDWMIENGYTKYDVKCAKAAQGSGSFGTVVGYYCRMLTMGCPDVHKEHNKYWESLAGTMGTPKPHTEFINKNIKDAIANGKVHVEESERRLKQLAKNKENTRKPTIQELLHRAAYIMTDDIECWLEDWIDSDNPYNPKLVKGFNPVSMLRQAGVKQAHSRIIRNLYIDNVNEFVELLTKVSKEDKDDWRLQLEEGYSHMTPVQHKSCLEVYRKIVDACDILAAESKANRKPRKVRIRSPEDLVKKLKFKQTDTYYGLASILPSDIIYARILVVFNAKNRKIGLYYAGNIDPLGQRREGSGLSVKGTTIKGFDPKKSLQRTIRKPDEFLPQIKKATRAKTEKLFQSLKTTETKLNGRVNGETILLATFNK